MCLFVFGQQVNPDIAVCIFSAALADVGHQSGGCQFAIGVGRFQALKSHIHGSSLIVPDSPLWESLQIGGLRVGVGRFLSATSDLLLRPVSIKG